MSLRLGDAAPNFTANTTEGIIDFHQWLGNSWGVLSPERKFGGLPTHFRPKNHPTHFHFANFRPKLHFWDATSRHTFPYLWPFT